MKKILLFALSLFLYMILQSCGGDDPITDPNKDNYKFLYIALDTTEHSKLIEYGIEKAKADYPNVEFTVKYPNQSANVPEQIAFIKLAVSEGYGGIIIVPASESLLTDDFKEALEKHVPVVIIDNPTNFADYVVKITTDNYKSGKTFGEYLRSFYNGSGKIAIVSDESQNKNNSSRINGFVQQLENSMYQGSFITPNVYHSNNYTSAFNKITTLINNNPDLEVIYATNAVGTLAAANALKALGKTNIIVLGYDNNTDCVNLLKNGEIKALGIPYPVMMGYKAVEQLINYKKGTTVTRVIDPGFLIVTQVNINTEEAQKALYPREH